MTSYKIPYGKKEITFDIPREFKVTLASSYLRPAITNIVDATKNALIAPVNSKRISEMVKEENTICVIVTDISRACPEKEILPPLIEEIKVKIKQPNLKLLIASGMHSKMIHIEKVEKYG